jgi:8-oxo-dGTP pyrophosphatase MutT (NUDIX family)
MIEKDQQAVVAYVMREDGKALSVTRKDTGQHSAPGGKVEPGETRLVAVEREVEEEVGIKIINPDCVHEGLHESGRGCSRTSSHAGRVSLLRASPALRLLGSNRSRS